MNDLSGAPCHDGETAWRLIVLNTLGNLTNREFRFASPRFTDDFVTFGTGATVPDGLSDDLNGDNVPELLSDTTELYPGCVFTAVVLVKDPRPDGLAAHF